eukprot:3696594-Prymnesium_polylepis.1
MSPSHCAHDRTENESSDAVPTGSLPSALESGAPGGSVGFRFDEHSGALHTTVPHSRQWCLRITAVKPRRHTLRAGGGCA